MTEEILRETPTVHHADTAGIETVLKTTNEADFYLIEEAAGYSMQIVTRSASGKSHFVVDKVRGRGIRFWRNAESAFNFIKKTCPDHIRPKSACVIFKSPEGVKEDFREKPVNI